MLAVGLTDSAPAWAGLRFVTGLCLAGQYVVAESWLNNLATNENRGRLLAIYAVVTSGAFGLGQVMLFAVNDATAVTGFAVASIITSLAVAPALKGKVSGNKSASRYLAGECDRGTLGAKISRCGATPRCWACWRRLCSIEGFELNLPEHAVL